MNNVFENKKCECHSYNGECGKPPEVKMTMLSGVTADGERLYKDIMIDACISELIQHLWDHGVVTLSSCCGHNIATPSIVLAGGEENFSKIRDLIAEKDNRFFELSQWRRVIV